MQDMVEAKRIFRCGTHSYFLILIVDSLTSSSIENSIRGNNFSSFFTSLKINAQRGVTNILNDKYSTREANSNSMLRQNQFEQVWLSSIIFLLS